MLRKKYFYKAIVKNLNIVKEKTHQLILIVLTLLAFGCKKDDDGGSEPLPIENKAPNEFTLSTVANGATDVDLKPSLTWSMATDPDNDPITYEVLLDTNPNPTTTIIASTGKTSYEFATALQFSTNFYWQVIAKDNAGNSTKSDIFNFTTKDIFSQVTDNAAFLGRLSHTSVTVNNKLWVIGGVPSGGSSQHEVWSSSDGIEWTQVSVSPVFRPRGAHSSIVFDNKLWVIGGYVSGPMNDVWSSPDGINWTEVNPAASFPARQSHATVVFDDKMWIIGGFTTNPLSQLNDVWNSSDGINWTQVSAIDLPKKTHHGAVVHDNKIWLVSGLGENGRTSDVWNSSDGVTWERITPSAPFENRYYHSTVAYDDKIWVIGGIGFINGESVLFNDVWSSSDGFNWTEVAPIAPFSPRDNHTSVVFDNKIWIIGGRDKDARRNDVWSMN